nr:MAG TPA: hypothetical protein [Caudoviricetes sp.]
MTKRKKGVFTRARARPLIYNTTDKEYYIYFNNLNLNLNLGLQFVTISQQIVYKLYTDCIQNVYRTAQGLILRHF